MKQKCLTYFMSLFCMLLSCKSIAAHQTESLDHIVAVVNTTVITASELNQSVESAKKQMLSNHISMPSEKILRRKVLNQLIDRQLQMEIAHQNQLTISASEVDQAIRTIAEQNHATVAALYQNVKAQGLTLDAYRKEIHDEMLLQKVQQQALKGTITLTPEEVTHYLHSVIKDAPRISQYHLQDILIPLSDSPSAHAIQVANDTAQKIVSGLRQGLTVEAVTTRYASTVPGIDHNDLGWRSLSEIPSAYSDLVLKGHLHSILGPVRTPNGFHVLRIDGIRYPSQTVKIISRKEAEDALYQHKYEEALTAWIQKLRSEATIHIQDADLKP